MKNTVRYEYKIVNERNYSPTEPPLTTELSDLSAEGWEVVSAVPNGHFFRVLLRREVKP